MKGRSHETEGVVTGLEEVQARARELEEYVESVGSSGEERPSFQEVEREIRELSASVERAATAAALLAFEPDAEEVEYDGRRYRRMSAPTEATYWSMAGGLRVPRYLFREVGVRNGPTIVPLELAAGIVDGRLTPEAAQASAFLMQALPSREAEELAQRLGVLQQSRTTLARTGEMLGQQWEENRLEGEDYLMAVFEVPEKAGSISVSIDRVSLPMEEPIRRGPGRPRKGAAKRPIKVAWRMAFCAVLTLHDAEGEPLASIRYGRVPGEGAASQVVSSLAGDLHAILGEHPDLKLVALADGAAEMQRLLDEATSGLEVDVRLVDFWHLIEKLAAAVTATGRDTTDLLQRWKKKLKTAPNAIQRILLELRTWALDYEQPPAALHQAITYLENNGDRMRYDLARQANLPIGSGHVEATCKTLVSTRMKRSGARWKKPGAQAIMNLRSLAKSSRWDPAMTFLLDTHQGRITAIRDAA